MSTIVKTATSSGVCGCCQPSDSPCFPGAFQCRTRGGTATLCGFSEYADASVPPKKYQRKDFAGVATFSFWGDDNTICLGPPGCLGVVDTWSGAMLYAAVDCATSGTGHRDRAGNGGCPSQSLDTATIEVYSPGVLTLTLTPTQKQLSSPAGCRQFATNDSSVNWATDVSITETLSEEDTEENAITRLVTPLPWSEWEVALSCTATWQQRTSGFSFSYVEAQWRILRGGLIADSQYTIEMKTYRRLIGTSVWELYQTLAVSALADSSGLLLMEGEVPNDPGYETYIAQGKCL